MLADIRTARASDLDALVAIEDATFSADRISRPSFARLLGRETTATLVAERGGEVMGYGLLLFRAGSRAARLYSIAVLPGAAGTGGQLLAVLEATAARRGADEIRLEVREDNARAIALYERSGYSRFGRYRDYYADGATALRYRKQLSVPHPATHGLPVGAGTGPAKMPFPR